MQYDDDDDDLFKVATIYNTMTRILVKVCQMLAILFMFIYEYKIRPKLHIELEE